MHEMKFPKTAARIARHDLVFGSPINDPVAGIPMGDGDTGSLIWLEADAIHIHINKTDLWDDSSDASDCVCSGRTEDLTCLRHGGELTVRFAAPCFDMIYQREFEARLSLADATLHVQAETVFSDVRAECFASADKKTTAMHVSYALQDAAAPEITLSRWGSRNFWRWYAQDRPLPEAGLDGTETETAEGRIYISQQLNGTKFCLGLAFAGDPGAQTRRIGRHTGRICPKEAERGEFTLYWNVSLGETAEEARENTARALDDAEAEGFAAMHRRHAEEWESFWNTSYMKIPQDYIENCYYLSLYYSNSECRGAYPPLFTNGIWGFRHDFSPWAYYFHYNMQHMYGPLEPSGHGRLAENYYRMRRAGLPAAYAYAEKIKNTPGAFYHDVTDRYGRGADYDSNNCTPGAQLGMAMYRHWRYNGDDAFLRECALPVMRGAAEFYLGMLQKEEDGLWHISGTTAYEGTPPFRDTITDLVMIRTLFDALAGLSEGEEKVRYTEVATHLPEIIRLPMEPDENVDGILQWGIGKGRPVQGDGCVFAIGRDDSGVPVRKNFGDPALITYGFPDTEMSPLYPAGIFGLKDKGSEAFKAMTNQILLHPDPEKCMYWCLMPLYLARMGMAEDLWVHMEKMLNTWQVYPCGLGAEFIAGKLEHQERLSYHNVKNCDTKESGQCEAYGFRHFDMEVLPIVAHAACEALLQSYDGVLRIGPAVRTEDSVQFELYAEGGFRVRCALSSESLRLEVESLRGESLRICLPERFCDCGLSVTVQGSPFACRRERMENGETHLVPERDLRAGEMLTVTAGEGLWLQEGVPVKNAAWKSCGNAHLGTPPLIGVSSRKSAKK